MTSPAWRCVRVVLATTGTVVLALLVAFIYLGRWLAAPAGTPAKADVIVLLGGDSRARLTTGLELWRCTFHGADASFVLIASRPRWWNASKWWEDEWSGQFVLMELIKMGYYFAFR